MIQTLNALKRSGTYMHHLPKHSKFRNLPTQRKGKAHPLQAMQAQRGLGDLRLLDFLTTVLYGGRLSALGNDRLYPQGYFWYSFSLGAESTPGPWFGRKEICH